MATPLTPARLLAALRAEGLTVREYRSWRTHERDDETGKHFGPVRGVMCHHTGPYTTESGIISLVYNGRSGLPGPLAHGVIDNAGVVWLTSAGRANHAGGGDPRVLTAVIEESYGDYPPAPRHHDGSPGAADGNDAFYGFECINEGDGKDTWPAVQYTAMVKAHAALCRAYDWGARSVIGHKEWSDHKVDPRGISMKTFRRDVAACLALPAGAWPDEEDDPMPKPLSRTDGTDRTLTPGRWLTIPVDSVDLLTDAKVYSATVHLTAKGLPGGTLQGRYYHLRPDSSRWVGPIIERPVTEGSTFADFPHTGSIVPSERLRFQVVYWPPDAADTAPATITEARLRGVYWPA